MRLRPSLLIGVVVALLFAGGLFAAWKLGHPAAIPPSATSGSAADPDTSADAVVDQALGQIPAPTDSAEIKTGWRNDVRGIDLDALAPRQRTLMLRYANSEMCTCGCGFTLAACRTYDLTCPVSGPKVEALRDSIVAGRITSAAGLRERLTTIHP
jgi:hypothetical protein